MLKESVKSCYPYMTPTKDINQSDFEILKTSITGILTNV